MTEARKKLDAAISELLDEYEEAAEPEPVARKIDHQTYNGWHIGNGNVWMKDGGDVNRETHSDLICVAPDLMREVILLVNAWGANTFTNTDWLREQVSRLRQRVIDGGFECDLDRT